MYAGWAILLLCIVLLWPGLSRAGAAPQYAGSAVCITCHADEGRRWQASHHAKAMQPALDSTVLGDFRDVRFAAQGR